jgi:hypothetical protein
MRPAKHLSTPTVAQVVRRAVETCDPGGRDELLSEFELRFEDRDEPVSSLGEATTREFFDAALGVQNAARVPAPAVTMAAAVATYLAYRRDEIGDGADELLRLAARAELGRHVPDEVAAWLAERGVEA